MNAEASRTVTTNHASDAQVKAELATLLKIRRHRIGGELHYYVYYL